ncbi:MAG: hypothetical protein CMK09_08275 [Ponticaulis sp.]|nr:hypothetical protein [Ponticaulis sp.]|tara:strand:- start:9315 stop:10502 length:1188 start_codon:yes stop_codon:yes gene_type:complete
MLAVPKRDLLPDILRSWALIGIVLVNVEVFSASKMGGYPHDTLSDPVNYSAYLLVAGLFTFKSFSLFSIMFGAGLGYQLASAERAGVSAKPRYFRRTAGLFVIGALHAIFLFIGDILVTYAILGSLLYFCRNFSPKRLFWVGGILISVQALFMLIAAAGFVIAETMAGYEWQKGLALQQEQYAIIDAVFEEDGFLSVAWMRLQMWPGMLGGVFFIQGVAVFGYFLIGLGLFRLGLISDVRHRLWKTSRYRLLPIGLAISFLGGWLFVSAPERESAQAILGLAVMIIGSPFSTLGYMGWLAAAASGEGPILRFIARGGSASLSAYLLQSIVLSLVFLEFGLGLFNQVSPFEAIMIALGAGIFSLMFTSVWLLFFKRGPFEILLRRWTYLGQKSPLG